MRLVGFDLLERGKVVFASDLIEFPEWVAAGGDGFTGTWAVEKGGLVLTWAARSYRPPAARAVGAADLQRAFASFHDAGADAGEGGELRPEHGSRRPGADDEHVDVPLEALRALARLRRRRQHVGVARAVALSIELHA